MGRYTGRPIAERAPRDTAGGDAGPGYDACSTKVLSLRDVLSLLCLTQAESLSKLLEKIPKHCAPPPQLFAAPRLLGADLLLQHLLRRRVKYLDCTMRPHVSHEFAAANGVSLHDPHRVARIAVSTKCKTDIAKIERETSATGVMIRELLPLPVAAFEAINIFPSPICKI